MKQTKINSLYSQILLTLSFLTWAVPLFAQKKSEKIKSEEFNWNYSVFQNSKSLKDYSTARMALYNIIKLAPDELQWKDSLALCYNESGMHESALLYAVQLLKDDPTRYYPLLVKAVSEFKMDSLTNSVNDYEKLVQINASVGNLVALAYLQCIAQNNNNCLSTIDRIQRHKDFKKEKVNLYPSLKGGKLTPDVAVIYLQASILHNLKQDEEALKLLNEALQLSPDFSEAKILEKQIRVGNEK